MAEDDTKVPGSSRVTVSIDTLRTEIRLANAELELRLTEKLASKDQLDRLSAEHARLEQRVEVAEKWITETNPLRTQFAGEFGDVRRDVEQLKITKAEEGAVRAYRRYLIGGGVLTAFFMFAQLALAVYVASHAGH